MATCPTEVTSELPPSLLPVQAEKKARKKKLVRRTGRDYSQTLRHSYQFAFLLMNVWIGGIFYLWVRHFETGTPHALSRPAGVEGYLPIAGMMNLKYWMLTGHVPAMHPAAMFLLITFVAIAFLFRKAFCSWLCPVGTISEYLWRAGRKIFRRNFPMWRGLDIPLRGLKYLLLGFFVWAVTSMSAESIALFMRSDYGVIADVKMLNFFRLLGQTGMLVMAVLVLASMLIQNFWCRYLCPYGALLGLASLFSPLRIRRNPEACIDCSKCAKACPSALVVDKLITIKSAECTGCLECVAACPAEGALQMSWLGASAMQTSVATTVPGCRAESQSQRSRPRAISVWAFAAGIAVLFFGIVGLAKSAGYWNTHVPPSIYGQLVPHANDTRHPMPGDPGMN